MRRSLLFGGVTPPRGNLVGWYKASQGITSASGRVSAWANSYGGAPALAQATGASQPIELPYSGQNYMYLPGAASNYASTPSAAANRITGDLDLRLCLAADTWTPASNCGLICKEGAANDIAYTFYLNTTGKLGFYYTNNGSSTSNRASTSSVAVGFASRETGWVRMTYANATGKVNYYTSTDGVTWSALGTEQTITSGTIYDSATKAVEIGTLNTGNLPIAGKVYRAQIMTGINGSVGQDFDPSLAADTASSFTAATGETWTVNASGGAQAKIVAAPSVLFDGAAHFMATGAFTFNQPETIYMLFRQVTWTHVDRVFDGNANNAGVLYQNSPTPQMTLYAGANGASTSDAAVGKFVAFAAVLNGAASLMQVNTTSTALGNAGTSNSGGLTLGASADANGRLWGNIEVKELLLYSAAHDTATRTRVARYLARVGGFGL